MKVITIPEEQEFLLNLLLKVQEENLILQTPNGNQFVLLSLEDWKSFDIGNDDNFEKEVKITSENNELIHFLKEKRKNKNRIPIQDVKQKLGLI